MENVRKIRRILRSRPTVEGAGVYLHRAFAWGEVPLFDPFGRQTFPAHLIPRVPDAMGGHGTPAHVPVIANRGRNR